MDNKAISSWVRQARYRAKKHGIESDLSIEDVSSIIEEYNGKCAYTGKTAETLDHPFPLKSGAPNVPANVLPVSKKIKTLKKSHDIVWLFMEGHISKDIYLSILNGMLSRKGGDLVRENIKLATGLEDESE